ncbi:hypothetical protein QNH48_01510 [Neobacillus sp. YX16]|uniref:hypothetical protein n=1 Tax=Neobacillus sp. YX16 TaxID=3047874 RepID=UPI0024C328AD|nr:hypothetical protein [Neobacillus sp. YX16]WHZ03403.1 hypothetical protein QNH48_01510 [Neobacillus sp. YX16]
MKQDSSNRDNLSDNSEKNKKEVGEEDMAIAEKELKTMQQLQQKKKLTRNEIRDAILKRSIQNNYKALERLSRT